MNLQTTMARHNNAKDTNVSRFASRYKAQYLLLYSYTTAPPTSHKHLHESQEYQVEQLQTSTAIRSHNSTPKPSTTCLNPCIRAPSPTCSSKQHHRLSTHKSPSQRFQLLTPPASHSRHPPRQPLPAILRPSQHPLISPRRHRHPHLRHSPLLLLLTQSCKQTQTQQRQPYAAESHLRKYAWQWQ